MEKFGTPEASLYIGVPVLVLLIIAGYFLFRHLGQIPFADKPQQRWNSFQLPFDQWQFISICWVLYGAFTFWGLGMPALDASDAEIACLYALHGVLFGFVVVLWLYLSFADPCTGKVYEDLGPEYYCDKKACSAFFKGGRRKHCRHCHKCVLNYDHHCFFLNTCVSDFNYKPFFTILTCFNLVNAIEIAATLGAIGAYHSGSRVAVDYADSSFGGPAFCVFGYFFLVAGLAAEMGAAALLGLHVYLCVQGITTFQWLGSNYEEERIRTRLKRELGDDYRPSPLRSTGMVPLNVQAASKEKEKDTEPMSPRQNRTKRHIFVDWCLPCITVGELPKSKETLDAASNLDTPVGERDSADLIVEEQPKSKVHTHFSEGPVSDSEEAATLPVVPKRGLHHRAAGTGDSEETTPNPAESTAESTTEPSLEEGTGNEPAAVLARSEDNWNAP